MCEYPQFYSHQTRKAKKQYKCGECHGLIQPGEQYHYHYGKWDGDLGQFRFCLECEEMRGRLNENINDPEDWIPLGGLCEYVFEGHNKEQMRGVLAIKKKRGGRIEDWQLKMA